MESLTVDIDELIEKKLHTSIRKEVDNLPDFIQKCLDEN